MTCCVVTSSNLIFSLLVAVLDHFVEKAAGFAIGFVSLLGVVDFFVDVGVSLVVAFVVFVEIGYAWCQLWSS